MGTAMISLVYIGRRFYQESGTIMSSLYTTDGQRFDWGFAELALEREEALFIRPATEYELQTYQRKLEALLESLS